MWYNYISIYLTMQISTPADLKALMSAVGQQTKDHQTDSGKKVHIFEQKVPIPSYLIAIVVGALESRLVHYYRPQRKFREGNVFAGVCQSTGECIPACTGLGGVCVSRHAPGQGVCVYVSQHAPGRWGGGVDMGRQGCGCGRWRGCTPSPRPWCDGTWNGPYAPCWNAYSIYIW